jgi:hypothetical protein
LYIVNIAVRLLVLAFVFVGGAITFAGPQADSAPAISNQAADMHGETHQEAAATKQPLDETAARDLG